MAPSTPSNKKRRFQARDIATYDSAYTQAMSESWTPPLALSPSLPAEVQASLMNMGMRIRKAVPEGYKTTGIANSNPFSASIDSVLSANVDSSDASMSAPFRLYDKATAFHDSLKTAYNDAVNYNTPSANDVPGLDFSASQEPTPSSSAGSSLNNTPSRAGLKRSFNAYHEVTSSSSSSEDEHEHENDSDDFSSTRRKLFEPTITNDTSMLRCRPTPFSFVSDPNDTTTMVTAEDIDAVFHPPTSSSDYTQWDSFTYAPFSPPATTYRISHTSMPMLGSKRTFAVPKSLRSIKSTTDSVVSSSDSSTVRGIGSESGGEFVKMSVAGDFMEAEFLVAREDVEGEDVEEEVRESAKASRSRRIRRDCLWAVLKMVFCRERRGG